jgi:putative membrane protein insertion efficiency factor
MISKLSLLKKGIIMKVPVLYLCTMLKMVNSIFSFLFSLPVYLYRYAISPYLGPACRHEPSCSRFALDALKLHGPVRGLILGTGRILRCRPGGTHGYDPVPLIWVRRYKPWLSYSGHWKACNRLKDNEIRN